MLLTLILCAVAGYAALVLPVAVVIGRALRGPVEAGTARLAIVYPSAPRRSVAATKLIV